MDSGASGQLLVGRGLRWVQDGREIAALGGPPEECAVLNRQQKEWRDPRDGQQWIVAREQDGDSIRIVFRERAEAESTYSIAIDTELSLARTSDGRLAELLDQARATPDSS